MKDKTLVLCIVFCFLSLLLTAIPKTQAYTLSTTYTVQVHVDGTASWKIEQSAYLETQADETSFELLIDKAMNYFDQFAANVSAIIDQASARTGRFMTPENITVGGNVTESGVGAYGFIDYSFNWTNFAPVEDKNIAIGDSFSNESFLFGDGNLSIVLPTGYIVKNCSPPPDHELNGLLEWNSVSDLQIDQPAILLTLGPAKGQTSFLQASPILFEIMLPLIGAVLASALVVNARRKKKEHTNETLSSEAIKEGGDTERILALLKKEGGQMLQSKITDQLRFSKAKTSRILGDMESKGFVIRHKTGRDKVVSLQNNLKKTKKPD